MSSILMTEAPSGTARRSITDSLLEMDEQGRAWIKGANTKVIEVALDWIAYRWDAETMHREHPHLSLAQIHAALSYYFAHQMEFDAEIARQVERVEAMRAAAGPQPSAEELRARLKARETGGES
ncbi:MAG: DUF433 domain-containing protein [Blastocatellia bacterium]